MTDCQYPGKVFGRERHGCIVICNITTDFTLASSQAEPSMNRSEIRASLSRCVFLPLIACFVVITVGCGSESLGSKVSGRVTLDGKPIGPGTLTFVRIGGGQNPATGNVMSADGYYTVQTNRTTGLTPGQYKVAVSIRQRPESAAPGQRQPLMPFAHPEKYNSLETSGLEYEIKSGSNTINIELKSE
jgi:hypothetical protein